MASIGGVAKTRSAVGPLCLRIRTSRCFENKLEEATREGYEAQHRAPHQKAYFSVIEMSIFRRLLSSVTKAKRACMGQPLWELQRRCGTLDSNICRVCNAQLQRHGPAALIHFSFVLFSTHRGVLASFVILQPLNSFQKITV